MDVWWDYQMNSIIYDKQLHLLIILDDGVLGLCLLLFFLERDKNQVIWQHRTHFTGSSVISLWKAKQWRMDEPKAEKWKFLMEIRRRRISTILPLSKHVSPWRLNRLIFSSKFTNAVGDPIWSRRYVTTTFRSLLDPNAILSVGLAPIDIDAHAGGCSLNRSFDSSSLCCSRSIQQLSWLPQ